MAASARLVLAALLALLAGCSGSSSGTATCVPGCAAAPQAFLSQEDVKRVIAQAVGEASARGLHADIAVADRVGNVLAVFRMDGAPATIAIDGGRGVNGGLDGLRQGVVPATLAAITKAITGSYLSSGGNAFSSRTAGQIIQEHFNPGEAHQPSGPLYGVQFSQLPCSDVNLPADAGRLGPKRSPLGLAADPGGLPLYKDGVLVGGIGVEADGVYGIDLDIDDVDQNAEELVAVAGARGFDAPADIRGDRITGDGRTFRYVDSEAIVSDPARAPAFDALPGALAAVDGYNAGAIRAGIVFGAPESGLRPDAGDFTSVGAWVLVDANNAPRYPSRGATQPGGGSLTANEAKTIVLEGLKIANRARGQIRRPLGAPAEVSVVVVDLNGEILAFARSPDAPLFGIDVAVQKARTVMFFSDPGAADAAAAFVAARPLDGSPGVPVAGYFDDAKRFLGDPTQFTGHTAWSARAVSNLHRPYYPDGIEGTPPGPYSTPFERWSPFNVGFQLDLVYNQIVKAIGGDASTGCASRQPAGAGGPDTGVAKLRDGVQIFPGGMPIYRGDTLVGGVGVSGDGVDQDDMVSFLGLARAGAALGTNLGNAPPAMRADNLAPMGVRLRYVQCPQSPFNDSTEQNVCAGL